MFGFYCFDLYEQATEVCQLTKQCSFSITCVVLQGRVSSLGAVDWPSGGPSRRRG